MLIGLLRDFSNGPVGGISSQLIDWAWDLQLRTSNTAITIRAVNLEKPEHGMQLPGRTEIGHITTPSEARNHQSVKSRCHGASSIAVRSGLRPLVILKNHGEEVKSDEIHMAAVQCTLTPLSQIQHKLQDGASYTSDAI